MDAASHHLSIDFASRQEAEDFSFMLGQLGLPPDRMHLDVSDGAPPVKAVRPTAKKLASRRKATANRQFKLPACGVSQQARGTGRPGGGPERRGVPQDKRES